MNFVRETVAVGETEITIESGKWAKQASGSVVIRSGDTMVLVTATGAKSAREGMNFLPLTCEYQEKFYAAGKVPGSYFRREGRPSVAETLVCRLIDRPVRPLFPKDWRAETQIIANVVSFDGKHPADMLSLTGASCALHLSDLVWEGPVAGIRVGRIDGKLVAMPTFEQREISDVDLIVAASRDAIVMVEGEMQELNEREVIDALFFAHESAQPLLDLQEKLRAAIGKPKREHTPREADQELAAEVKSKSWERLGTAMAERNKHVRATALSAVEADLKTELCGDGAPFAGRDEEVSEAYAATKKDFARSQTLETGLRIDGRAHDAIRPIACEVGVLPMAHGSALFTRGETQALVTATLGTKYDEKRLDTLQGEQRKSFFSPLQLPSILYR